MAHFAAAAVSFFSGLRGPDELSRPLGNVSRRVVMPTDLTRSAISTVAEILAKLGTDSKTGLNSVQLQEGDG
jgi:hypothetical protein